MKSRHLIPTAAVCLMMLGAAGCASLFRWGWLGGRQPVLPPAPTDYTLWALNAVGGLSVLAIAGGFILRALGFKIDGKWLSTAAVLMVGSWVARALLTQYRLWLIIPSGLAILLFIVAWLWGHRRNIENLTGVDIDGKGVGNGHGPPSGGGA